MGRAEYVIAHGESKLYSENPPSETYKSIMGMLLSKFLRRALKRISTLAVKFEKAPLYVSYVFLVTQHIKRSKNIAYLLDVTMSLDSHGRLKSFF